MEATYRAGDAGREHYASYTTITKPGRNKGGSGSIEQRMTTRSHERWGGRRGEERLFVGEMNGFNGKGEKNHRDEVKNSFPFFLSARALPHVT
jgi:hypothetical protein